MLSDIASNHPTSLFITNMEHDVGSLTSPNVA